MQNENETPVFARGETPVIQHIDEAAFFAAEPTGEAAIFFNTETKKYEVANAETADAVMVAECDRLNTQQISPGVTAADLASGLPDYIQNPTPELQALMDQREAEFLTAKDIIPETDIDGSADSAEAGKAYVQKIGDTNYYVQTDPNGFKKIVLPRGFTPKIDANVIAQIRAAQEEINPINEANGFETISTAQVLMSLTAQAVHQRQMSARYAPDFGKNHPFAVANRVKTKHPNVAPNSRAFRQLVKKEMGFKRFGNGK